jgi:uncharacterized protein (DUF342 family)
MEAFFRLNYTEAGVLLELSPQPGQGQALSRDELTLYLRRKELSGVNSAALSELLEQGRGIATIAPPQQELILNEQAAVSLDAAASRALLSFWPADQGGLELDLAAIRASLAAAGVVHGLDEAALQRLLQERQPGQSYLVASHTPAQPGQDGSLSFHFRREFAFQGKEDESGRVDYRHLELFERVAVGQLLVTRIPPTPGVPGCSVTGKELTAAPGKNVPLPRGKNIRADEENLHLYAAVSGMVVMAEGRVVVSNVYNIEGDADMSVGNIDFDGSVIIRGQVISGLTIKASGNIDIGAVVEAATIIAGGNIVLRHGMQGMNKGRLEAGGSVTAGFIERATVIAGENITANVIAHSIVEAGDSLYLCGKNGSLLGGQARVSNTLKARVIGSPTETPTDIGVGLPPHKRSRLLFLQQELKRLPEELEKLVTIQNYLQAKPSGDPKRQAMGLSVEQSLENNRQLVEEYSRELEELSAASAQSVHGKVHVADTVYSGVRLSIASASYQVMEKTSHCTFKIAEGEIAFGSYEA